MRLSTNGPPDPIRDFLRAGRFKSAFIIALAHSPVAVRMATVIGIIAVAWTQTK
jgi:hypothetical protein